MFLVYPPYMSKIHILQRHVVHFITLSKNTFHDKDLNINLEKEISTCSIDTITKDLLLEAKVILH